MTDDLIAVFQAFGNAAEKVLHLVTVIVRINYELVSLLLNTCALTLSTVQRVFTFFSIAVTDFIDQYGDWCQCLLSFLLYLWDTTVGAVQWVCSIPFLLIDSIHRGFIAIVQLPVVFIDSLSSVIVTCFSHLWAALSLICQTIINTCVFIIQLPLTLYRHTMDFFEDVDVMPLIAVLICMILVYLWYTGFLTDLILFSYSVGRRLAMKFLIFSLQLIETLLYIFAPQVGLAIRIVRVFWRPILAVFRAVFFPCLRICKYAVFCVLRILYRFSIFRLLLPERRHPLSRRPVTQASKRPEQNANADRLVCCVCQEFEKTILLQPCNHLCLCSNCVDKITDHPGSNKCPICRGTIRSYVDVYL